MRKLSATNFYEDKATHTWKIYFAAFLKTPLNDVEYVIKFYDVSGKGQPLIASSDQFTDTRGEKTIVSNIKLEKKTMGVNKEVMITLENKGRVLASGRFKILGEGEELIVDVVLVDSLCSAEGCAAAMVLALPRATCEPLGLPACSCARRLSAELPPPPTVLALAFAFERAAAGAPLAVLWVCREEPPSRGAPCP